MKLTSQVELMKNQKHAEVMAPDIAFDVLQTPEGDALFFSIGTDHVFYVTREARSSETGWTRADLSSQLPDLTGATAKVKTFDLSQNLATGSFDIILVATVAGSDRLFSTRGHSSEASDWAKQVVWTSLPFDAVNSVAPSPLTIDGVYFMNIPSSEDPAQSIQNCFVDILRNPSDPLKLLDRYYINLDTSTNWVRHRLPIDLKADSISSCLGYRDRDYCPGIYTYGLIEDIRQIIYVPQQNVFRPDVPPNPARFLLPAKATAIASSAGADGNTVLFVAAEGGLFVYGVDNQYDGAEASLIVPTTVVGKINVFGGVSSMTATTVSNKTVVWLLNAQGDLFNATCAAGREADPSAWSSPIPFCSGVDRYAFYLNKSNNASNVIFAHLSGEQMAVFTQNANSTTGEWLRRNILLPATKLDDFVEFNSFTATITVTNDNGVKSADVPVDLTAESPVAVYINNVYKLLTPDVPLQVETDAAGTITVIQETEKLTGVAIQASLSEDSSQKSAMDPLAKINEKLAGIQSGDDLSRITIKDTNGNTKPLVSPDISSDKKSAAAAAIKQLLKIKDTLPAATASSAPAAARDVPALSAPESSHLLMAARGIDRAVLMSGGVGIPLPNAISKSLQVAAGDLFNFFKEAWNEFEDFSLEVVEGAWNFIVKIGETVYRAVIDTAHAVWEAVLYVFEHIKIAFEDLVAWLGFIFNWGDILRTHRVIKHELQSRARACVDSIDTVQDAIETVLIDLEDQINSWAGVTDQGETMGVHQQKATTESEKTGPAFNSPQGNWAAYHTKNGLGSATSNSPDTSDKSGEEGQLQKVLEDLEAIVTEEAAHVDTIIDQIRTQVIEPFNDLTALKIAKKILAITADLVLKSARTIIIKLLDIVKILVGALIDALDAPLEIPIISPFYKSLVGDELSVLDLVCLIGAVPTTIAFKIFTGEAPFPDDATVAAGIGAVDRFRTQRMDTLTSTLAVKKNGGASRLLSAHSFARLTDDSGKISLMSEESCFSEEKDTARELSALTEKEPYNALDTLIIIFDWLAIPGAVCVGTTAWFKREATILKTPWSKPIRAFSFIGNLMYIGPNYAAWQNAATWPIVLNDICTILSVLKCGVDNVCMSPAWQDKASGVCELVLNAIWIAPAVGGIVTTEPRTVHDWFLFSANVAFDLAGILTPGQKVEFIFIAQEVLTAIYGVLGQVTGVLYYSDRE
ncbi:hypothetical protein F5B18DRAFT_18700 [Nemania serpens]|nr:hypothetical protein F5B18DRAFT_18700 [Nemania serpens]